MQTPLSVQNEWKVVLSTDWNVLGPFPIHAREQQFISPSFPLNLSEPIDFNRTWPSAYADHGRVGWTKTKSNADGELRVSFPNIRWSDLRATEGWAALQHAAVLHSSITLDPPPGADTPPRLLADLVQGSYVAILPESPSSPPEWHAGNIYDMQRTLPRAIELPSPPSMTSPTTYHVFISGNYEIRLFGDPKRGPPTQSIKLAISAEKPSQSIKLEQSQDVICDFVDGYAFGDAIGVGLRSLGGWWTVTSAIMAVESKGFSVELLQPTKIAPSQMRIIPLRIIQTERFTKSTFAINLSLVSDTGANSTVAVKLPLNHLRPWSTDSLSAIKGSYFYSKAMPTLFSAFPPLLENGDKPCPPVLCLHGAGVDIQSQTFWIDSLPRQQHSWLVAPSGRTPWARGLDWHGLSAKDAWGSVDALVAIIGSNPAWHSRQLLPKTPVVVLGHSNGGQGTWYLGTRFPDRVLAVVPASAYIKSQAYVALTMSRSAHFIDPAARAILDSSLTPDDNDLFLSNLVDTPVLAVHGGNDENVPVWHSRELVGVLETWRLDANVTLREDPRQSHWYPSVLKNDQVQDFLNRELQSPSRARSKTFTLTVAIPADSGSLHGWKIEALTTPGRLGRLMVQTVSDSHLRIVTSNVERFSFPPESWDVQSIQVDASVMQFSNLRAQSVVNFERDGKKNWKGCKSLQATGRIQSFLSTSAPFRLVVLDPASTHHNSVALRIAHDLNAYHRLDAEIFLGADGFDKYEGNILIIGDVSSPAVAQALHDSQTPFGMENNRLTLRENTFEEPGLGLLFLYPHPVNSDGRMLFLLSTDESGLERAARLFPIRTGVTVPDWIITSSRADQTGAAGVLGAGVWGARWNWNIAMSWLY
ncbi:hypothetical protein FB45DRAFT_744737 [Roridomyces roridus]|uniref:Peptidase S9 prolyl oligopeptidase catalytic domain-containing protein n=1 Tax=Roridomyces roridus TaxID=1738132 RepID=A0AAD7BVR7_9AGAR|nr:hypothetical protein FB45DRAFT_744737 [Roridomyces roridus]